MKTNGISQKQIILYFIGTLPERMYNMLYSPILEFKKKPESKDVKEYEKYLFKNSMIILILI